jgi:hypothetical protein
MNFLRRFKKPSKPAAQGKSNKKALCVGINNYPGTSNDLKGCVNDCKSWRELLMKTFGFGQVKTLVDKQATKRNIENELNKLVKGSKSGDILVFTYSGHGSSVPDRNSDEPDKKDETLYTYDGHLTDDVIRKILDQLPDGVRMTVISDSCHSGSITRAVLQDSGSTEVKPRFMPPEDGRAMMILADLEPRGRVFTSQKVMDEVLITGCKSTEFSYDARFNGRAMGAMSFNAIEILKQNPNISYDQFYAALKNRLPSSRYPQTPQLEGKAENRKRKMFT